MLFRNSQDQKYRDDPLGDVASTLSGASHLPCDLGVYVLPGFHKGFMKKKVTQMFWSVPHALAHSVI